MKNNKFSLEAFPLLIFLASCSVNEVGEVSTVRCDACREAIECSSQCEVPIADLGVLGCAPGDFYSVPPRCEMENNCSDAKSDCYEICDEQTSTKEEEIDCKVECSDLYGNGSVCEANFDQWVSDRQNILREYNECVRPCALGVSIPYCLENPGICTEEQHAALLAVEKVTLCQLGDMDACGFSCEDMVNNFHCHS